MIKIFVVALALLTFEGCAAFLFGTRITDTSGNVIGGSDPNQTSGLIGLGFLGASLGLAINNIFRAMGRVRLSPSVNHIFMIRKGKKILTSGYC